MSGAAPAPTIALDHLVVACRSLDAGRAWCEATFGVLPQPGGRGVVRLVPDQFEREKGIGRGRRLPACALAGQEVRPEGVETKAGKGLLVAVALEAVGLQERLDPGVVNNL